MKKIVFGILLVFFSFKASAQEISDDNLISVQEALKISVRNLEKKFDIVFPKNWEPQETGFEISEQFLEDHEFFEASYCPAEKRLVFHERYRQNYAISEIEKDTFFLASDTSLLALVRRAVYHELGHVYADALSRDIWCSQWPRDDFFDGTDSVGEFLMTALAEGIAEYFERSLLFSEKKDAVVDIYEIGHLLVKPILDAYGVRDGVAYIISHPPSCNGWEYADAISWYCLKAIQNK